MNNIKKELKLPFKRIETAHIIVAIVLLSNAIIFTENQISFVIQLVLGILILLHHIDDNILKNYILEYIDKLNESNNYQETLTESNNNAIIAINEKKKILTFNKKAEIIFGFTKDEMINQDKLNLIIPNFFIEQKDDKSESYFKSTEFTKILNHTHEIFGKHKDGKNFPIRISFGINNKSTIVIANISDITHEQEAKDEQSRLIKEVEKTQVEIISTLGTAIESKDKSTKYHVDRVSLYSKKLALLYGLNEEEAEKIKLASPLHDIGKIIIPDHILNKPGALTKAEFEIIKSHSQAGYDILRNSEREILQMAAIIAYQHHEKFDGTGYPRRLYGDNIHIYGRITAIADVFDALSTPRVYKKAWKADKVKAILLEERGKMFDPVLLDLFIENYDEFLEIKNSLL